MKTIRVFISSPADVAEERFLARGVAERLQGEFAGHAKLDTVFWEFEPLLATTDFQTQIPSTADCDIFITILWSRLGSPLSGHFVRADGTRYESGTEYEFETALEAQATAGRPHILVYRKTLAPTVTLEDEEQLLERVAQKRALERFLERWFVKGDKVAGNAYHRFDTAERFEVLLESHLRKLLQKEVADAKETPPRRDAAWTAGSPFRGLNVFEFDHGPVFFGRTRATAEVLEALRCQAREQRAFVLVLGMSGVGKSSLVRAGVLPMLTRRGVIAGVSQWVRATMTPSDSAGDPLLGLVRALAQPTALPGLRATSDEAELKDILAAHPASIHPLVRGALPDRQARLVLVVDQLEELFSDAAISEEACRDFVRALEALAVSGLVWVVATLRSDFYPRCEQLPGLMTLKEGRGQYDLAPPTRDEVSQMIRLPAQAAGLAFEENPETGARLDDVLRDQACANPEMLPLLEFTLEELYQRRTGSGLMTFEAYQQIGGVEGSVARRAEHVYLGLPERVQLELGRTLDHLVARKSGDQGGIRLRAHVDELTGDARAMVDAFVAARLFVSELDESGRGVTRIAHEALIKQWPRIQHWLVDNEENLRLHARLTDAQERWAADPSQELLLPEGKPLEEARVLVHRGVDLTPSEVEFIARSEAQVRRRHRLRSTLAAALVVLTVSAAVGAGVALQQSQRARIEASTASATTDFLVELFQVSDPWMASGTPGTDITAREVLDRGAQQAVAELADQPRVQANFLNAIGSVYQGLGSPEQARPLLERALDIRRELLGERHPDVAGTLSALAFVAQHEGDFQAAERHLRSAMSIWHEAQGPDSLDRALAMNLLSVVVASQDRFDEALAIQQEALRVQESHDDVNAVELANAYNNLGYVHMNADRYAEALPALERALAVTAESDAIGVRSRTMSNLAAAHQVMGHLQRARTMHEEALDLKRRWFGPEHSEIGYSLNNLAWVVRSQGEYDYAVRLYEQALENFTGAFGDDHPNVFVVRGNLARTLHDAGEDERAAALFQSALDGMTGTVGARSSLTLPVHVGLGLCYERLGRLDSALEHYRQAVDIGTELNPEGWDVGMATGLMASLPNAPFTDLQRDAAFERSMQILARTSGHRAEGRARILIGYARYLDESGSTRRAVELFSEALSIQREGLAPGHPSLVTYESEFETRFDSIPDGDR